MQGCECHLLPKIEKAAMLRAEGTYDPCLNGRGFKQGCPVQERPSPVGDAARTGDARVLATATLTLTPVAVRAG